MQVPRLNTNTQHFTIVGDWSIKGQLTNSGGAPTPISGTITYKPDGTYEGTVTSLYPPPLEPSTTSDTGTYTFAGNKITLKSSMPTTVTGLQPITQPVTYIVFNPTPTSFTVKDIVGDTIKYSRIS